MPCCSHLHNKNNYLPAFSATRKQSPQQGRRKEWQNVTIWQPTISVGLFRNFRISLDFRTPTKRWLLIVSKGDNCHHFDIFCHWMPAKHPPRTYLKDPPKRPLPTSSRLEDLLWPLWKGHNLSRSEPSNNCFRRSLYSKISLRYKTSRSMVAFFISSTREKKVSVPFPHLDVFY